MTPEEVKSQVTEIVVKNLGVDAGAVKGPSKFIEDLGADSLDIVELVLDMEKKFGIEIPEEEAENIRTVDDAINYIAKNKN
jgi:acyl carrier protein